MQARKKLTPCLLAAGGAGGGTLQPNTEQELSVLIDGVAATVTKGCFFANSMAIDFRIDTSVIPNFDKGALIEKLVQGPPDVQGKWNVCTVLMAFAPGRYAHKKSAKLACFRTRIADYPSRKELLMNSTYVYMDTDGIYQLLLRFNVPGVRKQAARLSKGANVGDAGAMRNVQAGASVQQPIADEQVAEQQVADEQVAEQQVADQEMAVATAVEVKKHYVRAIDVADVFGIDTSVIADFDEGALIEKVVQGAPDVQGKWNVCSVMTAFVPTQWKARRNAVSALAKTSIADYPSRKEVQTTHYNVS